MLGILPGALTPLFTQLFAQLAKSQGSGSDPSNAETKKQEAELAAKNAQFQAAKKLCWSSGGKLANYLFCVDRAKERIFNPPPPPPRRTPLERELALCESMGKPVQIWNCKQEAPRRLEARQKETAEAAARASKLSPLQRALNTCRGYSKAVQIFQCTQDAKEKYGNSGK